MLKIIKKNDTKDTVNYQLLNDDGSTVNLTGATVNFVMGKKNKLITNSAAVITAANDGIVEYQLTETDTLVSGTFLAEFVVTFANGKQKTFPSNGYITVTVEQNLDTTQQNVIIDMLAAKQGDFEAKLDSILQMGGVNVTAMNEWTWIATEGQLVYTFPSNAKYTLSSKWFQVYVGNIPVDTSLVQRLTDTQFSLVIDSSYIKVGMNVVARWTESVVPITGGHRSTHEIGGQDAINITQLTGYTENVAAPVKKITGFINISEYGTLNGNGITSDQTVIASAVADAKLKGYALNWGWDNKTYLTTANIPDFHSVKHIGNAIIKRGTDLFYTSPQGTQRNKIYVSTTGASNTFDGLSASQPVAKLQTAFDWLANYGPILTGVWEIVLTAGTFANRAVLKAGLLSENQIEISGVDVGGHPNVPTTIISEGMGASAVGIFITDGSRLKISNVKLTGFNGTSSSAGIKAANGSELTTSNVHTDSCYWGLSGENRSMLVVPDGIHSNHGVVNGGTGTGAAIRTLQLTRHGIGIQNNGNQTTTALFKNCYTAMLAQESSTGHADWVTVQDCTYGLVTRVNARINCDGSSFKRNGVDLRAEANAHIYISANVVFAPAGVDESANKFMTGGGGSITSVDVIVGLEMQYSTTDKVIDRALKNQTIATTTATNVYTATLKAPLWRNTPTVTSPMKKLFFKIFGVLNGTLGTKTINLKLGGIALPITFTAGETGAFVAEGYIFYTGQTAQTMFLMGSTGTGNKIARTAITLVHSANVDVALEALVANVADSVVIDIVEFGYTG